MDQHPQGLILLIDDEEKNLTVTTEALKQHGYRCLTARDGHTGIQRAILARPDLILLDVRMPGIDGFETCRRLKALPRPMPPRSVPTTQTGRVWKTWRVN